MALIIEVKVVPLSGRNQWKLEEKRFKCFLKSPPEKGKANSELTTLLAQVLGIPSNKISIVSGATTRVKRIKIDWDISFDQLVYALGIERQAKLF